MTNETKYSDAEIENLRHHHLGKVAYYADEKYPRMQQRHQYFVDMIDSLLAERNERRTVQDAPDWRIAMFDRWREAAQEKGYAGIAEAINAVQPASQNARGVVSDAEILKELANEVEACWICASIGEGEITLETINNWSGRLSELAALEAHEAGRGQPLRQVREDSQGLDDFGRLSPDAGAVPDGMVLVTKEDGNNYCLMLTATGMEEEGDPVAEVEALRRDAERYRWLRSHYRFANDSMHELWFDESLTSANPTELDREIDAAIAAKEQS